MLRVADKELRLPTRIAQFKQPPLLDALQEVVGVVLRPLPPRLRKLPVDDALVVLPLARSRAAAVAQPEDVRADLEGPHARRDRERVGALERRERRYRSDLTGDAASGPGGPPRAVAVLLDRLLEAMPLLDDELEHLPGRHVLGAGEGHDAEPVVEPELSFACLVTDPLVATEDDEAAISYDRQLVGILRAERHLGQIGVAWVEDVVACLGERATKADDVLIDEKARLDVHSRRATPLEVDGLVDELGGQVVDASDTLHRFAGGHELREDIGADSVDRRGAEGPQWVEDDARADLHGEARRLIAGPSDALEEGLGAVGEHHLPRTRCVHEPELGLDADDVLSVEDEVALVDPRSSVCERVRHAELLTKKLDDRAEPLEGDIRVSVLSEEPGLDELTPSDGLDVGSLGADDGRVMPAVARVAVYPAARGSRG